LNKIYSQHISVGNQKWKVKSYPVIEKFNIKSMNSWIILSGGVAFTFLLTIYLSTLVSWAKRVRQEVEVRTSQLQEAIKALHGEVLDRKSAQLELQSLNETLELHIASRTAEVERKAQYLEQFAYVTSHDLKSPLRAVSNLAQWIEEDLSDKLDDTSREQLALLRDRVRRMHDLIEGLLEYSRVGYSTDSESRVDTRELIDEIIDSLSPPKGFTTQIKGNMPVFLVDRLQLGQVFSNLISNSLKHHGGKKGKIQIKSEIHTDFYKFFVCDDGKGIATEYHDKVFMMFQVLESSDLESSTGIGLYETENLSTWTIKVGDMDSSKIRELLSEEKFTVYDMMRNPRDRESRLNCIPLLIKRKSIKHKPQLLLLPEAKRSMHKGDEILFCGDLESMDLMHWSMSNVNVFQYIKCGKEHFSGYLWKNLKSRMNDDSPQL